MTPAKNPSVLRYMTRTVIQSLAVFATASLTLAACTRAEEQPRYTFQGEIPVGLLHSLSGTMAVSEDTVITGEVLAIEEINALGGLQFGSKRLKLVPLLRDGRSDPAVFAQEAQRLVEQDQVSVVFGGWTSSSRKAMLPVFKDSDSLLFYPIQYEGEAPADNVLYFGATPNQQSEPAINWLFEQGITDFFLIGSDYVYPRTANAIMTQQIQQSGGRVVGEVYLPLGTAVTASEIDAMAQALPDGGAILNTVNGDDNEALFRALSRRYMTVENGFLAVSFSIDEATISQFGSRYFVGSYVSQGFFQCLEALGAVEFVEKFKARFGDDRPIGEPSATAYTMVHMWARAVTAANSLEPAAVSAAMSGLSYDSPAGPVSLLANQHLTKHIALGQVQRNGDITIVTQFGEIEPEPVPSSNASVSRAF